MKVRCSYCDSWINDTDEKCPHCGGTNKEYKRTTDKTPKTIAELQKWYEDHHLPPQETTRFFIGVNYKKPRAFGIYRNGKGEFVVYKNKDNGQRAIRYQGTDEAYAVNELYQKLKEEILNQKRHNQLRSSKKGSSSKSKGSHTLGTILRALFFGITAVLPALIVILCIGVSVSSCTLNSNRHEGYYRVDDKILYHYYNTWYEYDDWTYRDDHDAAGADTSDDRNGKWVEAQEDYDKYTDIWDYNLGKNYDSSAEWDSGIQSFTDSYAYEQAYEENEASHSSDSSYDYDDDYDYDYDWDSGDSWDSDYSDWGSDW